LLSVLLLQVLYGIRSERQLMEGQKRKNDTHASTTDPDCRLYRKAAQSRRMWHRTTASPQPASVAAAPSTDASRRHQGYGMSQSCRAMTECIFGWGKQHDTMRKTSHRGIAGVAADFLST
jgi:hypothetical protein